jgi:hypothetical protein
MPQGKPAAVRCVHLDERHYCRIFHSPDRPSVCANFQANEDICGKSFAEAMDRLQLLERLTASE